MVHDPHSADTHGHHVIPKKTLMAVFGALVALTILTVLTAQVDLGILNVPLALTIAGTKAALVVGFFMALKYDNPVNSLVFAVGTMFVIVFIAFTLFDTAFRGDIGNVNEGPICFEAHERMARGGTLAPNEQYCEDIPGMVALPASPVPASEATPVQETPEGVDPADVPAPGAPLEDSPSAADGPEAEPLPGQ